MSSNRRPSGEINILAMLEGRARGPRAGRMPALGAALWYGSAGLLACALVGALSWLAHETDVPGSGVAGSAGITVVPTPDDPTSGQAPPSGASLAAMERAASGDASSAAHTSLDAPAPERALASHAARPELTGPEATPKPAVVAAAFAKTANSPAPKSAAARIPANRLAAAPANRTAPQPRPRRGASASRPAMPKVDLDVALISAIIQHAARPNPEEPGEGVAPDNRANGAGRAHDGATCADQPCGPKPVDHPS